MFSYPINILEGSDQQVHKARYGTIFAQRRVVGGTQGQIADQPDNGLDEWPAGRRVHEANDRGEAALQAHRVL